jgi:hypothetical protein
MALQQESKIKHIKQKIPAITHWAIWEPQAPKRPFSQPVNTHSNFPEWDFSTVAM